MRDPKRLSIALLVLALAAPPVFAQTYPPPPGSAPQASPGDPPGRVGRIALIEGKVDFHADADPNADWAAADLNYPVTPQSAIWTEDGARAEIEVGHARIQLDSGTELVMTTLDDRSVVIGMPQGRADIDLGYRGADERTSIVTPRGAVDLTAAGHYRIIAGTQNDPTRVAVFDGAASFTGSRGSFAVAAGSEAVVSGTQSLSTATAGIQRDGFDAWALGRDRQYEAAARSPDYVAGVTGYQDLAPYGVWSSAPDYGAVWYPNNVASDWVPYSDGRWAWIAPWGWTWIGAEPWGFAPYHYGRWAFIGSRWGWVPGTYGGPAVYAPALVTFVANPSAVVIAGSGPMVGWIPLAPGEVYRPAWVGVGVAGVSFAYFSRLNAGVPEARLHGFDNGGRFANRGETEAMRNARFATVVNRDTFVNADPVRRGAVRVNPNARIEAAPTAQQAALPAPSAAARTGGAAITHRQGDLHGNEARPKGAAPAVANAPLPPTKAATPAPARGTETNRAARPGIGTNAIAPVTPNAVPQAAATPPAATPQRGAATERDKRERGPAKGAAPNAPAASATPARPGTAIEGVGPRPTPAPATAAARPPAVAAPAHTAATPREELRRPAPPVRPVAPAATPPTAVKPDVHRPAPTAPVVHPVAPAVHPAPPVLREAQVPPHRAAAPAAKPVAPAAKPAAPAAKPAAPTEEKKPE
jgi:hypothetical protein